MRFVVFALLLAACAPTGSGSLGTPSPYEGRPDPFFQEVIDNARAASGQWFFRSDEGVHAACFGAPQSECQLSIQCEAPTGTLTVAFAEDVAPDQRAVIQIHTEQSSLTVFGQSHNEGLPTVIAVKPPGDVERDSLIELFSTPSRFAVEAHALDRADADLVRFPWDDSIRRVINACRD